MSDRLIISFKREKKLKLKLKFSDKTRKKSQIRYFGKLRIHSIKIFSYFEDFFQNFISKSRLN